MDIDSIPPGVDFEEHIRREIEVCDVVLVLIGDNWLDVCPGSDIRRIDEPDDFVRLEIESAMAFPQVRIVPVLVEGAQMPRAEELPRSIQRLGRINAIELSDQRWTADLARLAQVVEEMGVREREPVVQQSMRLADVDKVAVADAVRAMPGTFRTKDVSGDAAVLIAHAEFSELSNYHVMIGRYVAKNHVSLGLGSPESPVDDCGAVWHKEAPHAPDITETRLSALAGKSPDGSIRPERVKVTGDHRTPWFSWVIVSVPTLTVCVASFLPPLWAAWLGRRDRRFCIRMLVWSALLLIAVVVGFSLVGTSRDDTGAAILVSGWVLSTILAVVYRKPTVLLPGTEQELARRRQREQYRQLIKRDPGLARGIGVGRPDLVRNFDDGGLLDLNTLTADELTRFGSIPIGEAQQIVETRKQLGGLSTVDELVVYASLSDATLGNLRETAVFH